MQLGLQIVRLLLIALNALHLSAVVAGKLLGRKNVTVREADAVVSFTKLLLFFLVMRMIMMKNVTVREADAVAVSFTKLLFFMAMMMMNAMVTDAASRCNPFTKYFPSSELDLILEILAAPQNKVKTLL